MTNIFLLNNISSECKFQQIKHHLDRVLIALDVFQSLNVIDLIYQSSTNYRSNEAKRENGDEKCHEITFSKVKNLCPSPQ